MQEFQPGISRVGLSGAGMEGWGRDRTGQSLQRRGLGSGSCQAAEPLPEEKRLPHRSAPLCCLVTAKLMRLI